MSELISQFHFLRPQWLLLLLPSLALGILLWRVRGREASWARVVAPELLAHLINSDSIRRSRSGVPALIAAWCIAALAAAGPSWQQLPQPVLQKQDALVMIMDLSYSMLATDLQPSRQDRVRRKLLDLLRERKEGLTALIAYAGDAHIVAPLTDDNPTIANLLPALTPQMMPLPGSNTLEAIESGLALLDSAGVRVGRLLVVTDGVTERDARAIAALIENQPRQLIVLGVGTDVGAPIALPGGGFLKDENGEIVVPALNEGPLRQMVAGNGGIYSRLSVDDRDLRALLDNGPLLLDQEDTIALDRRADQWQDMAHWLVLPLLLIALASFRRGWIYSVALLVLVFPAEKSQALEWQDLWLRADQQAAKALRDGDAALAAERFKDPAWRGTAEFTAGDYEEAAEAFSGIDTADGWYNRGNALAGANQLDAAIKAYQRSLELKADQEDAQRNIETLERLKAQQEQSQQSDSNQQSDDQQGEQQDSSDSQQQNPQDPQNQQSDQSGERDPNESRDNENPPQDGADPQDQQSEQEQDQGSEGDAQQSEEARGRPVPQPEIDNSAMQEDMEKDQAMQQWLRRVPDDPSGLLREKFRYESRQRQQQGKSRETTQIW